MKMYKNNNDESFEFKVLIPEWVVYALKRGRQEIHFYTGKN